MTTAVYQVPDISCGHCKAAIEGEVGQVEGVETVVVDIDTRTVTVTVTASDADERIRAAIDEAGYDVEDRARR
jgi:copper chaperone